MLRDCLIKVVVVQHKNAVGFGKKNKNKCTDKEESSKLHLEISALKIICPHLTMKGF